MKKWILLLGMLLIVAPAFAQDFVDNDRLYGVGAGGMQVDQFNQTWTDHKAQLSQTFPLNESITYAQMSADNFDVSGSGGVADKFIYTLKGYSTAAFSTCYGLDDSGVAGFYPCATGGGTDFAFDTFPLYEDSAHVSGIAVNIDTLAIYSEDAGKWLTVALTDTLDPTPVAGDIDDFNRANENPIAGDWSIPTGNNGIQLAGNAVKNAVNEGIRGAAYWNATAFGPDQCSYATIATAADVNVGPGVRFAAASFSGYVAGAGTLGRMDSGAGNTLATYTTGEVGDEIKLCIVGDTLTVFINDVEVGTATDSTYTTGQPGVSCRYGAASLDDWGAY